VEITHSFPVLQSPLSGGEKNSHFDGCAGELRVVPLIESVNCAASNKGNLMGCENSGVKVFLRLFEQDPFV
jgi:hypothetical protein